MEINELGGVNHPSTKTWLLAKLGVNSKTATGPKFEQTVLEKSEILA